MDDLSNSLATGFFFKSILMLRGETKLYISLKVFCSSGVPALIPSLSE